MYSRTPAPASTSAAIMTSIFRRPRVRRVDLGCGSRRFSPAGPAGSASRFGTAEVSASVIGFSAVITSRPEGVFVSSMPVLHYDKQQNVTVGFPSPVWLDSQYNPSGARTSAPCVSPAEFYRQRPLRGNGLIMLASQCVIGSDDKEIGDSTNDQH